MDLLNCKTLNEFLLFLSLDKLIGKNLLAEQLLFDLLTKELKNKASSWRQSMYAMAKYLINAYDLKGNRLPSNWRSLSEKIIEDFERSDIKASRGRVF